MVGGCIGLVGLSTEPLRVWLRTAVDGDALSGGVPGPIVRSLVMLSLCVRAVTWLPRLGSLSCRAARMYRLSWLQCKYSSMMQRYRGRSSMRC